jgi:hypothetical protein
LNKFMALMVFGMGVPAMAKTCTIQRASSSLGAPHSLDGSLSRICWAILRRLTIIVCVMFCTFHAHAATCTISSGAIESTIQSTLNSCGSGNTATFAAGTYSLSSALSVPCGVSLRGPVVPWAPFSPDGYVHLLYGPTAVISATAYPVFSYGTCSTPRSLEYLEVNTNHPSPSGGQVVYATNAGGVSNLTISFNYFHGNQGPLSGEDFGAPLIFFDGGSSAAFDANDTVSWNRFGANGDCSNLMNNLTYPGFQGDGGYCNATGYHTNMSNFVFSNNFVYYQEEGFKGYESTGQCTNCLVEYNDFSNWHRIAIETQTQPLTTTISYLYNSMHDPVTPGEGTFALSSAGCSTNTNPTTNVCTTIDNSNVIIDNVAPSSGQPFNGLGIEFWSADSASTGNNNLIQGEWSNSFMISTDGAMTASNNRALLGLVVSTTHLSVILILPAHLVGGTRNAAEPTLQPEPATSVILLMARFRPVLRPRYLRPVDHIQAVRR